MSKEWFLQRRHWELGNFIMATPCLKAMSGIWGKPCPVFFDTPSLATLYKKCPFINILGNKPVTAPFATSEAYVARREHESDSEYLFRKFAAKKYRHPMPHTYVDKPNMKLLKREPGKKYVAIFQGCLSPKKIKKKAIQPEVLEHAVKKILHHTYVPVFIGHKGDWNHFWKGIAPKYIPPGINFMGKLSLRESVSVLGQCDAFISNDTGLAHVAGAYDMPGVVMWYWTCFEKNRSPSKKIIHAISREKDASVYKKNIDEFLDNGLIGAQI